MARRPITIKNRNSSFRTHKVRPGDSYISIANRYTNDRGRVRERRDGELPLNYEDVAYWNGYVPGQEAPLHKGDRVYLEDPYILNAAVKVADAPTNISEYGSDAQGTIAGYSSGVENGTITMNQVPAHMQTAVMQNLMTNSNLHNQLASRFSHLINTAINPAGELSWYLTTKGGAAINDKLSGRNEYATRDLLNPFVNTPMTGRAYASEHPTTEFWLQAAASGIPSMTSFAVENAPSMLNRLETAANNGVAYMKTAANDLAYGNAIAANPATKAKSYTIMDSMNPHNPYRNNGFHTTKGNGQFLKITEKPSVPVRPRPVVPIPTTTVPSTTTPFVGMTPWIVPWGYSSVKPFMLTPNPQKNSIFEQYSLSNWQLPYNGNNIGPVTGPASKVYSGYAPIGSSEAQQPIGYFTSVTPGTAPRVSSYSDVQIDPWVNYKDWNGYLGNSGLGYRYNEGVNTPMPSNVMFKNGGILKRK